MLWWPLLQLTREVSLFGKASVLVGSVLVGSVLVASMRVGCVGGSPACASSTGGVLLVGGGMNSLEPLRDTEMCRRYLKA